MDRKLRKQIQHIAEEQGWAVGIGDTFIEFQRYSIEGHDFVFEIDTENVNTLDEVRMKIIEYYNSFDVSYETYLWLDDRGHGKNGAPDNMRDIYDDMQWCKNHIFYLSNAMITK